MAGRPRKPRAQAELKGRREGRDSGGRPLRDEPEFSKDVPKPPATVKGEGLKEWKRLVPEMVAAGVLTGVHWGLLVTYCEAWARRAQLVKAYEAESKGRPGSQESMAIHRALDREEKLIMKARTELCITPATRSKATAVAAKDAPTNPLGKFSKKGLSLVKGGRKR